MSPHQPRSGHVRTLNSQVFFQLFDGMFVFGPTDRRITFFVDLPHGGMIDTEDWHWLRKFAAKARWLFPKKDKHGQITVDLIVFPATGTDGAPLPREGFYWSWDLPKQMETLPGWARRVSITEALKFCDCAVFTTRWSATSVLKRIVKENQLSVRIATLPGFTQEMMPVFSVDPKEAARRTLIIKALLDQAVSADIRFAADNEWFELHVDLRHPSEEYDRKASTGQITEPGQVANGIPAEAFVAPYDGEDSETNGILPIQIGPNDHPIFYRFEKNRVVEVFGKNRWTDVERALIEETPTRGNLAELGFGVMAGLGVPPLSDFLNPDDVMLLIEKLGFHIAFGDGGRISAPIHRDHVFLKDYMPRVRLSWLYLNLVDGSRRKIMVDNNYTEGLF